MFLWLLAVRFSTSCVSKLLVGKPQKHDILTSCGGLRVLTAQELLAALLARALFLGCTVLTHYTREQNERCTKNLSSQDLTNNEVKLLSGGLKFTPTPPVPSSNKARNLTKEGRKSAMEGEQVQEYNP